MAKASTAGKRRAGGARKRAGAGKAATGRGRRRTARSAAAKGGRRWSRRVTARSNALDLEGGVFTWKDPKRIASSLKRSAQRSKRRKADPFRSALSMLTFYINRAGKDLPASRKKTLMQAKDELRRQFGRASPGIGKRP